VIRAATVEGQTTRRTKAPFSNLLNNTTTEPTLLAEKKRENLAPSISSHESTVTLFSTTRRSEGLGAARAKGNRLHQRGPFDDNLSRANTSPPPSPMPFAVAAVVSFAMNTVATYGWAAARAFVLLLALANIKSLPCTWHVSRPSPSPSLSVRRDPADSEARSGSTARSTSTSCTVAACSHRRRTCSRP